MIVTSSREQNLTRQKINQIYITASFMDYQHYLTKVVVFPHPWWSMRKSDEQVVILIAITYNS